MCCFAFSTDFATSQLSLKKNEKSGLELTSPKTKAAKVQLPYVLLCVFNWFCHLADEFEKSKNTGIESTLPSAKVEAKVQLHDILLCLFNWLCQFTADFEKNEKSGT